MDTDPFSRWARMLRRALLTTAAVASVGVSAQVVPTLYQHCEVQEPAANAVHRIETNYRYAPSATLRTLQDYWSYRCEPAWAQSPDILGAFGSCPYKVTGCSVDNDNACTDGGSDDWTDYEALRGTVMSDAFQRTSSWPQNPAINVHSGPRTVQQWGRHRWWSWSDPQRYAFMGVTEQSLPVVPASYPRCYGMTYLVGLFNGVWNTQKAAEASLKTVSGSAFVGAVHRGSSIKYRLFYNQSGCNRSGAACLEDVAEVFSQRSVELDQLMQRRWEFFWEQVTGRAGAAQSFSSLLRSRTLNGVQALVDWFEATASAAQARIKTSSAWMLANPPTGVDAARHVAELIAYGKRGHRAVLVAHSQGNLFVNAAYDGYLAHAREAGAAVGEDTGYVAAKVVHVAPASVRLTGPHVLAEIDLVINGLRGVDGGPVAPNTLSREVMPPSLAELSGHALVETYLDPERLAREDIKQLILQAMNSL